MSTAFNLKTIGFAALLGAALVTACGDDEDNTVPTGPSGPTTSSSGNGGNGGNGGATSTTTTGGNGGTGGATPQTCQAYCDLQDANCTGADDQWGGPGQDYCLGTCATWAAGTPDDTTGNTLACRIYHTETAGTVGTEHCSHGGPHGGPADDAHCQDMGDDQCDVFCELAMAVCTGNNAQFGGDLNTCLTECAAFPGFSTVDADYSSASNVGDPNDFACRFWHLTAASADTSHCPHIVTNSPTCTTST